MELLRKKGLQINLTIIGEGKIKNDLGWVPEESFQTGLRKTVEWYLNNQEWIANVQSGEYQNWVQQQYQSKEA